MNFNKIKTILYINSNNLNKKTADIKQSINTVNNLSLFCNITYYSSWINKKDIADLEKFFTIKINFKHKKVPIIIFTKTFLLEKITRLIYCIFLIIHLFKKKYDVILTRDFSFLYFLGSIPEFLRPKIKIVFEVHKIYHKTSKKVNFNQENKALSQVELFITNSGGTKKGLIDFFNINDEKILVLHNGVNLDTFKYKEPDYDYLKNEYEINKNDKIVIYTGSFLQWKGVEYLIYAFDFINNKDIKLLLIGGFGKDKKRIEKIVDKSKNKKNIIVKGVVNQQELIKLLSISKIAIIPNNITNEGMNYTSPVKIFEYLAMGLPIIASRLSSIMEILKEKDNCLFFEPGNSKDLAKKIVNLLKNKLLLKSMAKKNITKSQHFSWRKRTETLLMFLEKNYNA